MQPEQILLDEPTTADLQGKVTQAWQEFAKALAAALLVLPEGARLDLTLDPTASGTGAAVYAVTTLTRPARELTAYAVGNRSLPEGYRLTREAVANLVALGWSPPGVVEGSGEHFGYSTTTDQAKELARLLARTMRDVYGAPHPAFLVYQASTEDDEPVALDPIGTARLESDEPIDLPDPTAEDGDEGGPSLADQVSTVIAAMMKTTPDQLQVDNDGDIGIRAGSAMVFVRVRDNPPLVDVFSPVLTEIEATQQLYVRLSELTNRMPIGRLYYANDIVWASVPVLGRKFQAVHLMLAVQVMTGLADELDDRLHGEFGGRRFFGEGDKPPVKADGERTGMYL